MGKKALFEIVKKDFSDKEYKLISTFYKSERATLEFICLKHPEEIQKTNYRNLKQTKIVCKHCKPNIQPLKFTYEFVYNYFKEQNCELLSEAYINVDAYLNFRCSCGNIDEITFYSFRKLGLRCRECKIKRTNHSGAIWYYDEVKQYIEENQYKLITTNEQYINTRNKIIVSCNEGHDYPVTFKNFKKGRRCPICNQSKGEIEITKVLNELKINYTTQHELDRLVGIGGNPLRFDFAIFDQSNDLEVLIEYDGEFHFHKLYEADSHEMLLNHDKLKNTYCKINNIPLIRIPYWEFDNVDFILENVLGYFKLINQQYSENIIHKISVNHSSYRKPSPRNIIKKI